MRYDQDDSHCRDKKYDGKGTPTLLPKIANYGIRRIRDQLEYKHFGI